MLNEFNNIVVVKSRQSFDENHHEGFFFHGRLPDDFNPDEKPFPRALHFCPPWDLHECGVWEEIPLKEAITSIMNTCSERIRYFEETRQKAFDLYLESV